MKVPFHGAFFPSPLGQIDPPGQPSTAPQPASRNPLPGTAFPSRPGCPGPEDPASASALCSVLPHGPWPAPWSLLPPFPEGSAPGHPFFPALRPPAPKALKAAPGSRQAAPGPPSTGKISPPVRSFCSGVLSDVPADVPVLHLLQRVNGSPFFQPEAPGPAPPAFSEGVPVPRLPPPVSGPDRPDGTDPVPGPHIAFPIPYIPGSSGPAPALHPRSFSPPPRRRPLPGVPEGTVLSPFSSPPAPSFFFHSGALSPGMRPAPVSGRPASPDGRPDFSDAHFPGLSVPLKAPALPPPGPQTSPSSVPTAVPPGLAPPSSPPHPETGQCSGGSPCIPHHRHFFPPGDGSAGQKKAPYGTAGGKSFPALPYLPEGASESPPGRSWRSG